MLQQLHFQQFQLFKSLTLELHAGLNMITGESGAGKSILLDGLALLMGERSSSDMVRAGAQQAVVSGTFDQLSNQLLQQLRADGWLSDDDRTVTLRRLIAADGKSRMQLNDQSISLQQVKTIAPLLIHTHTQQAQLSLTSSTQQRDLLDAFGNYASVLEQVRAASAQRNAAEAHLKALTAQLEQLNRDAEHRRMAMDELTELNPQVDEESQLLAERQTLQQQHKARGQLQELQTMLDDDQGLLALLHQFYRLSQRLNAQLPELMQPINPQIDSAVDQLSQVSDHLSALLRHDQDGESRLEALENRLYALRDAARKYNIPVSQLMSYRQTLHHDHDQQLNCAAAAHKAAESFEKAHQHYLSMAAQLTEKRKKAAADLAKVVHIELAQLNLPKTRFEVRIEAVTTAEYAAHGMDHVTWCVSFNPGMAMAPLCDVASGGELSRMMLAVAVVLPQQAPTLIFDEIDTGVGGAIAAAMGQRLKNLSAKAQVIAITHAPQVASFADAHWLVSKSTDGTHTEATCRLLTGDEQREEIARMLSAAEVTAAARQQASDMLSRHQS